MSTPLSLTSLTVPSAFADALISPIPAALTSVTTFAALVADVRSTAIPLILKSVAKEAPAEKSKVISISLLASAVTPCSAVLALIASATWLAAPVTDPPIKTSLTLSSFAVNAVPLTVSVSKTPALLNSLNPIAWTSDNRPAPPVYPFLTDPASIVTWLPSKLLSSIKPVKVCDEDVKPTVWPPFIIISSPVVLDNVIELSAFKEAVIPETDSLILETKFEYELAKATVSPLIVNVELILNVPIAFDVNVLKAFALAPCVPVLRFIASAIVLAVFTVAVLKSVLNAVENASKPLILMSDAAIEAPLAL